MAAIYVALQKYVSSNHNKVFISVCSCCRYDAIGPRQDHVLSFEKGEEIEIIDFNGTEWWEVSAI